MVCIEFLFPYCTNGKRTEFSQRLQRFLSAALQVLRLDIFSTDRGRPFPQAVLSYKDHSNALRPPAGRGCSTNPILFVFV